MLQPTSPDSQPNLCGFSAVLVPELVSWRKTKAPALPVSRPLQRDRAVDETGHRVAVFGRIGSRPFTLDERGVPWTVPSNARGDTLAASGARR